MTINTQKQVVVLAGPTGPTGTFQGVNILSAFTGVTGELPTWVQATGATGPNGTFKSVYNIGPTGLTGGHKNVIINGFSGGGAPVVPYSVNKISGGSYNGSGSTPASGLIGTITGNTGDYAVLVFFSARENSVVDFHRVMAINGSTLTWTHKVSEDFTYTDAVANPSFPVASYHCDVYIAKLTAPLTNQAWSSTMTGGDTFVNQGYGVLMVIAGGNSIDSDASNGVSASNLTGVASTLTTPALSTHDAHPFVMLAMFQHKAGGGAPTVTIPAGFATTVSGQGNTNFSPNGSGSATEGQMAVAFKEFTGAQSGFITTGASNADWYVVPVVLGAS